MLYNAERTLSRDSSTARSPKPTILNEGKLLAITSTSTVTGTESKPTFDPDKTFASISGLVYHAETVDKESLYLIENYGETKRLP